MKRILVQSIAMRPALSLGPDLFEGDVESHMSMSISGQPWSVSLEAVHSIIPRCNVGIANHLVMKGYGRS